MDGVTDIVSDSLHKRHKMPGIWEMREGQHSGEGGTAHSSFSVNCRKFYFFVF